MTKIVLMKELLDTFSKEKVEQLLKIGEVRVDEKEIPYIVVDAEAYLKSNINLDE